MKDDKVKSYRLSDLNAQLKIHKALHAQYLELRRNQYQAHASIGICNVPESKEQLTWFYELAKAKADAFKLAFKLALNALGGVMSEEILNTLDKRIEWQEIELKEQDTCDSSVSNKVVLLNDRRALK